MAKACETPPLGRGRHGAAAGPAGRPRVTTGCDDGVLVDRGDGPGQRAPVASAQRPFWLITVTAVAAHCR